jgi:hypothetical protein
METTVLGVRLNKEQRERLKAIGADNKMTEVETVRLLVDSVISGRIKIEKGRVASSE